jgi:hypothetical protein
MLPMRKKQVVSIVRPTSDGKVYLKVGRRWFRAKRFAIHFDPREGEVRIVATNTYRKIIHKEYRETVVVNGDDR